MVMPFAVAVAMADKISCADHVPKGSGQRASPSAEWCPRCHDCGPARTDSGCDDLDQAEAVWAAGAAGVFSGSLIEPRSRSAYGSSRAVIQIPTEPVTWSQTRPA